MRAAEPQFEEAQQQGGPEFEIDLREHLKILRKRLWLIVGVAASVVAIGAVYLLLAPRVYRAEASIIIEASGGRILGDKTEAVDFGPTDYWSNKEYFETQYKVLASKEVLSRVVEKKGLARDLDFLGVAGIENEEKRAERLEEIDPVFVLSEMMRVEPVKNSQLAKIVVEDRNPERAAELANAIVEAYIEAGLDTKQDGTRAASQWLSDQLLDLKGKLEQSEVALYTFRRENDILATSIEDRQNINSQRLVALNESLTKVMAQRVELQSALAEVDRVEKGAKKDPYWALGLGRVATHPTITKLREEVVKQESAHAGLTERYLENHPQLLASKEKLAKLRSNLAEELKNVVASLRSQYREVATTETELTALIDGLKNEAFEINKREIDQRKLERETENNRRLYDLVLSRLKDSDLAVMLKNNNVRLLDKATTPDKPVKPRPALVAALSLLLGALGGVGLAYLVEMLDNTLKQEDDIESVLQLPFLGLVPSVALANAKADDRSVDHERDLFAARNTRSSQAEAFRAIRTNLLFMSTARKVKRVMVTSSAPQEGKSMTAIGIGSAMASAGNRVLLVDTDMRRPRLHRSMGVANEVGISTVLLGETAVQDAVKNTEVNGLYLMPCGPVPPNPAELLHSEKFQALLDQLGEQFDLVILDSPPVLAAADAAVLSTVVDGVIFVTRFKKTTKDLAKRMLRTLRDINAPVLGAVLNDVDLQSRAYGYSSYERYGYYGDTPANG
ncbi:GumC family protein [Vulgatibacter sp.]|uniref:GumC family protein n=1 Tax=Vulgatibacter sp. TaxID=1971226 RepID=UPI003565AAA6